MITLERLLLEIVAFDFRARNSADVLAALCHEVGADETTGTAALAICLDVHRTLAILKQTRQALACACLELAARFLDKDVSGIATEQLYQKLGTSRGEVTGEFCQRLLPLSFYIKLHEPNLRGLEEQKFVFMVLTPPQQKPFAI